MSELCPICAVTGEACACDAARNVLPPVPLEIEVGFVPLRTRVQGRLVGEPTPALLPSDAILSNVTPELDGPCRWHGCDGVYENMKHGDCTCHISPPCPACEHATLICSKCSDEPGADNA